MLKMALFDCAINEKCCSVDGGRGICPLFSSPPRGIWQLKSPHTREFAIQGKKNANDRGSAWEWWELQSFLFIVVIVYRFYLKLHFHKFQSIASYWWKCYNDWTRKKSLLRPLNNIGMTSEKLYRNTLHSTCLRCLRIVFWPNVNQWNNT